MNERDTKELEQLKHFSLNMQETTKKQKILDHREKKIQYARQIIYTNQGHLPTKATPDIDFIDKLLVQ